VAQIAEAGRLGGWEINKGGKGGKQWDYITMRSTLSSNSIFQPSNHQTITLKELANSLIHLPIYQYPSITHPQSHIHRIHSYHPTSHSHSAFRISSDLSKVPHSQILSSHPKTTIMMLLPSSLLISLFLLTHQSTALPVADDGMWHPASYTSVAPIVVSATAGVTPPVHATTAAVAVSKATTLAQAASADWQTAVTWPAGCESWANPCPAGAHISGGAVATGVASQLTVTGIDGVTTPYENGFTSYTTMTDSNGVITGMPAKATVAAGVTANTLSTAVAKATGNSSVASGSLAAASSSKTQSGFTLSTSKANAATNGAASKKALGGAALFGIVSVIAALL
jgi:hypothetical protein